ncbi:MAG: S1/P1 nuclease [Rhodanobacter sp.]
MSFIRRGTVALFFCLLTGSALAWGPLGHEVVAELAQRQLDPAAKVEVARLLSAEPGASLRSIASWPDQMQNDPAYAALWRATRSQHYINFHGADCAYDPPRDCRDGQCIIAGLKQQVAILGDRTRTDAERLQALKFVVHFVGDVHQPLHAGYRDDKGGNTYQVQFEGNGSNLHRVWDSGLLSSRNLDAAAYADRLATGEQTPLPASALGADQYVQWARESCLLTAQPGFYPAGHRIGQAYVDAELPLAEQRLRLAGHRLAIVLNHALEH